MIDTQVVSRLKRDLRLTYGHAICSETIDDILLNSQPAFSLARKNVKSGQFDWDDLRLYSTFCRFDTDVSAYQAVVNQFDESLEFPAFLRADWVGDGFGGGSLNAFRAVVMDGEKYFEKIYRKDSQDYKNVARFFRIDAVRLAEKNVVFPGIGSIVEGERLVAVYYRYVESDGLATQRQALDFYSHFFSIIEGLASLSDTENSHAFRAHELYLQGRQRAIALIGAEQEDVFMELEAKAARTRLVLSHGDWYRSNITCEGVVFDWDRYGYYPVGFDLGYCLSKSVEADTVESLMRKIQQHVPDNFPEEGQANLLFFSFVFYSRRVGMLLSDETLLSLYGMACRDQGL